MSFGEVQLGRYSVNRFSERKALWVVGNIFETKKCHVAHYMIVR